MGRTRAVDEEMPNSARMFGIAMLEREEGQHERVYKQQSSVNSMKDFLSYILNSGQLMLIGNKKEEKKSTWSSAFNRTAKLAVDQLCEFSGSSTSQKISAWSV